jgi:ABC-type glutathione transport system ATPase component
MKLVVNNVSKVYISSDKAHRTQALSDINFVVDDGSILGIVGESGCGKSTLSRIIAGLEAPETGTVEVGGSHLQVISRINRKNQQRDIQLVFQDPYSSLNPRQTIFDSISEVVDLYEPQMDAAAKRTRTLELLAKVGIGEDLSHRYPHQFSGGQRQRICIARSLAAKPKLLILDEPVSALDVSVRADIINLLLDLKREFNLTYIFVSHDLEIVKHFSDFIMVMNKGKVVEYGDWKSVMENPKDEYTQTLIAAMPKPKF